MSDLLKQPESCRCHQSECSSVKHVLEPKEKDLDSFTVRRLLPATEVKSVGPFVFFDHLGPAWFPEGKWIDVRPHPHIGLATITYLFEGEILHRDSLGYVQPIRPNEINWMTAGKGIVHSERTPPEVRAAGHTLHALQLWVALPAEEEECEPGFFHYDDEALPERQDDEKTIRVMVGEAYGLKSSVKTWSSTLYVEVNLKAGARIELPADVEEKAVYLVAGDVRLKETPVALHSMIIFDDTDNIEVIAVEDSRLVIIGGTPLGKRTVWWNLVASRKELIEKAKEDWQNGRFPEVPGETEFIPLP